ncbi:bifunctional 3'-5' exonuclease/DNA polymerase [Agromyces sp. NPDC060279]|uniref:bifunctional 3'-5' exonuclease/DNA polymerase n=1 Tax=Agromyces sp. NPDC060279 TaxID=3347092 RepID=UPI0036660304
MLAGTTDTRAGDVTGVGHTGSVRIAIGPRDDGLIALVDPEAPAQPLAAVPAAELAATIARFEREESPRWVWSDTRQWYPKLLAAGVRVERCDDLLLAAAILDHSTDTAAARERGAAAAPTWIATLRAGQLAPTPAAAGTALFDFDDFDGGDRGAGAGGPSLDEVLAEDARQRALTAGSARPRAMRLLLAAESAGALIGAELHAAGLPWSREVHERVLETTLGPRPRPGAKPEHMERFAAAVRRELEAPGLNLDSQLEVLRALRAAGIPVESTSRWELREHEHPAIEPLISYKKLARLANANGWAWLDEWIVDGRFRPDYVPGGTATGRWATSGGGALQLPKLVRSAVVADPGWRLVVADAAQLEPRVLAALARDEAMADAARGRDVYRGIVEAGVVEERDQAKIAVLGAMYGATTGDSGRLVPRLARAFPRAMALVDRAAAQGERGGSVTTNLGRSSPLPPASWREVQQRASEPDASPSDERRARSSARDWGRFTRNFVVQGSAAEWSLCWMAALRSRLAAMEPSHSRAAASGPVFEAVPHLVYYLHDEIIVHTPAERADEAAAAVAECAAEAGRLLFGDFPLDFPLDLAVVDSYALAEG